MQEAVGSSPIIRLFGGQRPLQICGFQEVKDAYRGSFSQVLSETRRRPTFCFHLEEHLVLGSHGRALSTPSLPWRFESVTGVHAEERKISWAIEEDSTGFSRMVSDWRAGFSLQTVDGGTRVIAESAFQPTSMLVRLMSPLVKRKFHHAQTSILAGLKQAAENRDGRQTGAAYRPGGTVNLGEEDADYAKRA